MPLKDLDLGAAVDPQIEGLTPVCPSSLLHLPRTTEPSRPAGPADLLCISMFLHTPPAPPPQL